MTFTWEDKQLKINIIFDFPPVFQSNNATFTSVFELIPRKGDTH